MITTRTITFTALASLVCTTTAITPTADQALRAALEKRQNNDDGGSEFACHANCGYTIIDAGDQGISHCSNQSWVNQLNDCLACAGNAHLWGDYGDGVNGVARQCGYATLSPGQTVSTTSATAIATKSASATIGSTKAAPTAVTNCHTHDDTPYCEADGSEWEVETHVEETDLPDGYENCRANDDDGDEITCVAKGSAQIVLYRGGDDHADDDASSSFTITGIATTPAAISGPTAGGASSAASSQPSKSAAAATSTNAATLVGPAPASFFALIMALFAA